MKYLAFHIITFVFISCSGNYNIIKYNKIIDDADTFKIYKRIDDTFVLENQVYKPEYAKSLKSILTRHINPEYQKKFIPNAKIEIYNGEKLKGALLISTSKENPFVNFSNGEFGFGFKLTYGIGMYLDGSD